MVEPFVIFCPCCSQPSSFTAEFPRAVFASAEEFGKVLAGEKRDDRVFACKNKRCSAPAETIICSSREVAREIQHRCLADSWLVPIDFRLRKNEEGELYWDRFGVVYNRKPVRGHNELCLTDYVDQRLLSKALLGFAVREDVPVTVFVAYATHKGVYWAPIEAAVEGFRYAPFYFSQVCAVCREAFGKRVVAEFEAQRPGHRGQCAFRGFCPREQCPGPNVQAPEQFSQCLRYLDLRKRLCPCYSSELDAINTAVARFKEGIREEPTLQRCWAGFTEVAFPIVVHDHFLGVLMTGQFAEGECVSSVEALLARERDWRKDRDHKMEEDCLLSPGQEGLAKAVAAPPRTPEPGQGPKADQKRGVTTLDEKTREVLFPRLAEDLRQISHVAKDRYGQEREGRESAFRAELAGMLSRRLLEGCELASFLPEMLKRMAEFWSFEHVCLLVGGEEEGEVRLYATEREYFADGQEGTFVKFDWQAGRWPLHVLVPRAGRTDPDPDCTTWQKFIEDVNDRMRRVVLDTGRETYVVTIAGGPRTYVFCFNHRIEAQLSTLPYFSKDLPVRISRECKDQVLRTCQSVADRLHHFWLRVDEEQSHRSLGHTLRSSLTVMTRYQSRLRDQLRIHKNDVPDRLQGFYSVAQNAHECARIGSKVIDHELDKLTLASTLEEVIVAGSEGEADVASILRNLEPQFKLSGEADGKRWYWLSRLPNQAIVRGSEELINLAVRNVIDNSFKYSLHGKDVRIELRRGKKHWRLTVHNDGVAIRADEIPRITLKGYRGVYARKRQDVAAEGTGLGMYLVKRVMDAIDGRVCVKCECHTREGEALETGVVSVALVFPALDKE